MKRFVENVLNEWITNKDKSALLVEGARQVGKTYSLRNALQNNNISYYEINFLDRPDILEQIKNLNDVQDIISKLELLAPTPLARGESIIFFDEIQEFPEIITKIKFLVDECSYRYILSGSLL